MDALHGALASARKRTGEHGEMLSPAELGRVVRRQMDTIKKKHGDVKVKFKVVIEDNKAKVKASFK